MRRTISATMLAVALLGSAAVGPVGAVEPRDGAPPEEHCVLVVTGKAPDGELQTRPMVCERSQAAALQRADGVEAALAQGAIGVHYDGAGFTGSSVTVVGVDCLGGWLNLPSSWNDRISSTLHGCPDILHFLHVGLTGPSQHTFFPGGNLGATLNNEVSSIQYLA